MHRARHRLLHRTPVARADRSDRIALTSLAFASLVGPAWTLHTHASQMLDATAHRAAVATPDNVWATLTADR
ncbi:hypothetical protein [Streptomyces sp. WAC08241]|uniref:hypothetical protein n=1 Tax=Streptomyces sp. WAC08241 TaxID=2487421 RepID=UPI00163BEAC6|nr:hypothetical protein [Streptomyces sp. WAC08241]